MDERMITKKAEALGYLMSAKIAVVSTHAPDGTIDASAVFFISDSDFQFYFTTKVGTRKYQNMVADPRVTVTIPDADTLRTIEAHGTARMIIDHKEIAVNIAALIQKSKHENVPWSPPIAKLDAGQYVIVQVTPTWLRYGVFLNEIPKGEYFTQMIPAAHA